MRSSVVLIALLSTAYAADFTTYIGGTPTRNLPVALATDSQGNTYVAGWGAFVAKLDSTGNIVFTKQIAFDGYAIAADASGNIWIGGHTYPSGFLMKMAPDGTVLYSSPFGGKLGEAGVNGIATDQSGNVYVTGWTDCSDYQTTPGLPASPVTGSYPPVYGLFAAKLNSTGQILYSTVIAAPGGSGFNIPKAVGYAISVDASANAVVAGTTYTAGLPVGDPSRAGDFVFKINSQGNEIVYFNYPDLGFGARAIAADASGSVYLAGYSDAAEAMVKKLDDGGKTVWATLVGRQGDNNSQNAAISLDSAGNIWLTGTGPYTYVPFDGNIGPDFVAELSADGSSLLNLIDFPPNAAGQDIVVDQSGVLHLAGPAGLITSLTPAKPVSPRVFSVLNAAAGQVTRWIAPGEIVSLYGTSLGPATPISATPQNGQFPTSVGGVQVLVNGTPIPLLYVSDSQINAEIPSSIGGGDNGMALVQVRNKTAALPDFRLAVVASDFAAFTKPVDSLVVVNQDGTLNEVTDPAQRGSFVSIWATGLGTAGLPATGAVLPAADNYCSSCKVVFTTGTTSKDITETVQYAGSSPGLIDGLMQINFQIPAQLTNAYTGAWVKVLLPGSSQPVQVGWVNVAQQVASP
ncbi:MAG TPA: SBBP repeat-containing protein [Bryobacteraceae bacterium]|nr:SBBP repeat-containing protein [Bryobacteraceae bacterium]